MIIIMHRLNAAAALNSAEISFLSSSCGPRFFVQWLFDHFSFFIFRIFRTVGCSPGCEVNITTVGCTGHLREIQTQTHKRFKRTLFIRTRQNQQLLGVIPFVKLQNET